ncbi:MAG TPA: deoxyribonuclease V [Fimbriiglobus sp.]|nr:deoxyribonuclease V [Fimbriiglobus sp.]
MPPVAKLHDWNLTPKEAVALQRELAARVDTKTPLGKLDLVAGCDVSYDRGSPRMHAAIVVVRVSDLSVVESMVAHADVTFPYVPGLLSFREAPPVLAAWKRLRSEPDAVMLDAQGIAHPRRLGLACHVGLWLDRPCVGCAKSRLVGTFAEPGPAAGDTSPLTDKGEQVGVVMRTRARTKPVFVSPGHRLDLEGAVAVVRATLSGYRLPVPTRLAHVAANQARAAGLM